MIYLLTAHQSCCLMEALSWCSWVSLAQELSYFLPNNKKKIDKKSLASNDDFRPKPIPETSKKPANFRIANSIKILKWASLNLASSNSKHTTNSSSVKNAKSSSHLHLPVEAPHRELACIIFTVHFDNGYCTNFIIISVY